MRDEPIYYINHFSRLKRPAIYSKYEYWGYYLLSMVFIVLFSALWSLTEYWNPVTAVMITIGTQVGVLYNLRLGRRRAESYRQYWQGTSLVA